jgi:hypothetical protein
MALLAALLQGCGIHFFDTNGEPLRQPTRQGVSTLRVPLIPPQM